jgi:hypothetical protein
MTSLQKFLFFTGWVMATPVILYGLLAAFLGILSWCHRRHVRHGRCRVCGCTDDSCFDCVVAATGGPCWWVDSSHTLCSRCVNHIEQADLDDLSPACSPLNARRSNHVEPERGWPRR